jgi:CRP-like cAMP-binding protein
MLLRLLQQAPAAPDVPAFADWLRATLTRQDLSGLPADDVDALRLFAVRRAFRVPTTLFAQGARPAAVYIVEGGAVELVHDGAAGPVVVQTVRRGVAVGDLPVMLDMPHAYTAVTRGTTTVLELRLDTIRALVDLDPGICCRFLRLVSRRLAGAERRVLELGRRSAFERLVHLLLREADEGHSLTVQLTQAAIAGALGLSRQTVSSILAELERQRLVERRRGRVVISDKQQLERVADPHAGS